MKQRGRKAPVSLAIVPPDPPVEPIRTGDAPAPAHLSAQAAAFWAQTVAEFALQPHHLLLLASVCEQVDLIAAARSALAAHGSLTVTDPMGRITAHPGVAIQRNATIALSRLLRELDLDTSEFQFESPRPPRIPSNRG